VWAIELPCIEQLAIITWYGGFMFDLIALCLSKIFGLQKIRHRPKIASHKPLTRGLCPNLSVCGFLLVVVVVVAWAAN